MSKLQAAALRTQRDDETAQRLPDADRRAEKDKRTIVEIAIATDHHGNRAERCERGTANERGDGQRQRSGQRGDR